MIFYLSDTLASKRNGGVSLSGVDFLQLLRLQYEDITVITTDTVSKADRAATDIAGQPLHPIHEVRRLAKVYRPRRSLRSLARFVQVQIRNIGARQRIALCDDYQPDHPNILFVNSWSDLYIAGRIRDDPRFKTACIVRGNPESFFWQTMDVDKTAAVEQAGAFLRQFDFLIFVSSIGRDRWQPYLGEANRSYYLPNSIDESTVRSLLEKNSKLVANDLGLDANVTHLVAVGSVQTRKGQDTLIQVAQTLRAKGHSRFKIHVIGVVSQPYGGLEIARQIQSSDVAQHFVMHGHREDALKFIYAADICIFPSRAEAFPRTIAEYMALGKPIVSTDASGIPEMIKDRQNGLLCRIDEGKVMGEKVAGLLDEPDVAAKLGAEARLTYETKFSKRSQAERAKEIFTDIDRHLMKL
ncbi:glycosyltransferase family 4 protein [Sulfitobacter pontiacus]|uniref:glycosyltransferase family 4 protein n=1 Tax=Sulfitobacter pontiacus TaxID=60137 RepID=UPI00295E2598|nr:glycosyltransferase family 4 protein [Sulfitobacter pontiacus]